ncbi:MAG: sterol desaturase family protein [Thermodesulfovibrionales bacterium]|jgi:hypothetical protein
MIATEQIYQTVALILIVGLLDTLERIRPRFLVNRRLNLRLNIIANLGHLEWLLITPNFHRIHHGTRGRGLASKNLGFVLTFWDRMFRTYANPQTIGDAFALSSVSMRA